MILVHDEEVLVAYGPRLGHLVLRKLIGKSKNPYSSAENRDKVTGIV